MRKWAKTDSLESTPCPNYICLSSVWCPKPRPPLHIRHQCLQTLSLHVERWGSSCDQKYLRFQMKWRPMSSCLKWIWHFSVDLIHITATNGQNWIMFPLWTKFSIQMTQSYCEVEATHLEPTVHTRFTTLSCLSLPAHNPCTLCRVQIKGANSTSSGLTERCTGPYYPQCIASLHRPQTETVVYSFLNSLPVFLACS